VSGHVVHECNLMGTRNEGTGDPASRAYEANE
jgi:hypothetical protein